MNFEPRAPLPPSSVFFGWAAALGAGVLVGTTALVSAAPRSAVLLALGAALDLGYVAVVVYHIARLAYLVFHTRGLGHYSLTLWRLVDALLCNVLGHVAVATALWKAGAAAGTHAVFTHTGAVSPWYALYDLVLYSAVFYCGGGVTDNAPLHEAARAAAGAQWAWQAVATLVFFAAAVATLQMHTDEDVVRPAKTA